MPEWDILKEGKVKGKREEGELAAELVYFLIMSPTLKGKKTDRRRNTKGVKE